MTPFHLQVIFILKYTQIDMKLVLKSTVTKKTSEYQVTDSADSRLFYHFPEFQLEGKYDDGEYEYELYDDSNEEEILVAQGLLQIGDYTENKQTTYENKNGNIYKQYNG